MANSKYSGAWDQFAQGNISWKAAGGSTIRAFLVDSASYTPSTATHTMLSDISTAARKGNLGSSSRADAPALTLVNATGGGVCDATDITFTAIPAGAALEYLVIFKDDGVADATSPLIVILDTATGLPITPNGADITITWDNGASKIFQI